MKKSTLLRPVVKGDFCPKHWVSVQRCQPGIYTPSFSSIYLRGFNVSILVCYIVYAISIILTLLLCYLHCNIFSNTTLYF
ncbi:hypothetical protein FKM82_000146 [Ascaphus truei]